MSYYQEVFNAFMRVEMAAKAEYRANLALWMIGALVEPIVYLIVWINVANARGGSIGDYAAGDFAAYYLVLLFVRQATAAPGPQMMSHRIRSGDMSFMLLRPVHPIFADLAENLAHKASTLFALVPIALLVGLAFGAVLNPSLASAMAFFPALLLAATLRFVLQYGIAIVGFWTDRIDGIFSSYWTMQTFFSGMLAPIVLLPAPLRTVANILPFRWIFAFPIDLMLGRLTSEEALTGFAAQVGWIAASTLFVMLMWRNGVKRFGAYGG